VHVFARGCDKPTHLHATVSRSLGRLRGEKVRLGGPALASRGTLRVESATLDTSLAEALLDAIEGGPLGRVETFELTLSRDGLDLAVLAPSTATEWLGIGDALVSLEGWLMEQRASAYRA